MQIQLDLATVTGREILKALTWDILQCGQKASQDLPVEGTSNLALWTIFDECRNIPSLQEINLLHDYALQQATQEYWYREVTEIARAFAALAGVPPIRATTPVSEFKAGCSTPESLDAALESEYNWNAEYWRIKQAITRALGKEVYEYEQTPMFWAVYRLNHEVQNARAMAIMWASLYIHQKSRAGQEAA
jgi:hypothetical protein